jgi:hypothetical protein
VLPPKICIFKVSKVQFAISRANLRKRISAKSTKSRNCVQNTKDLLLIGYFSEGRYITDPLEMLQNKNDILQINSGKTTRKNFQFFFCLSITSRRELELSMT